MDLLLDAPRAPYKITDKYLNAFCFFKSCFCIFLVLFLYLFGSVLDGFGLLFGPFVASRVPQDPPQTLQKITEMHFSQNPMSVIVPYLFLHVFICFGRLWDALWFLCGLSSVPRARSKITEKYRNGCCQTPISVIFLYFVWYVFGAVLGGFGRSLGPWWPPG